MSWSTVPPHISLKLSYDILDNFATILVQSQQQISEAARSRSAVAAQQRCTAGEGGCGATVVVSCEFKSNGAHQGSKRLEVRKRRVLMSSVVPFDEGRETAGGAVILSVVLLHPISPVRTDHCDPVQLVARRARERVVNLVIELLKKTVDDVRPMMGVFDFDDEHSAHIKIWPFDPRNFENEVRQAAGDSIFIIKFALRGNNVTLV